MSTTGQHDMPGIARGFCAGRRELAGELISDLRDIKDIEGVIQRLFWTPAWCESGGRPQFFFDPVGRKFRFDAIGFEDGVVGVAQAGSEYLRLAVTSNWYLCLAEYNDFDRYFEALSPKSRKKLRWLMNVYEREKVQFLPVANRADIETFLSIFATQWPESVWVGQWREAFVRVYLRLIEMGRSRSFLVRAASGEYAACSMGFLTEHAYSLGFLARRAGVIEKFSPGFFLSFWMVKRMFETDRPAYFLFGPGEFEYKKTFLAGKLPIYRYERRCWGNMTGILRLYLRAHKERRKQSDGGHGESSGT